MAAAPTDFHSFRLATPVIETKSRFEVTAFAGLSLVALTIWLLILPLEIAFGFAV